MGCIQKPNNFFFFFFLYYLFLKKFHPGLKILKKYCGGRIQDFAHLTRSWKILPGFQDFTGFQDFCQDFRISQDFRIFERISGFCQDFRILSEFGLLFCSGFSGFPRIFQDFQEFINYHHHHIGYKICFMTIYYWTCHKIHKWF